ncbi:MAG: hypothetical protein ABI874_11615 [Chloroflexota bacterium]
MRVLVRQLISVAFLLAVSACGVDNSVAPTLVPTATPTFRPVGAVATFTPTATKIPESPSEARDTPTPTNTPVVVAPKTNTPSANGTPTAGGTVAPTALSQPTAQATPSFTVFGTLGAGDGEIARPRGIAIGADGIYVVERGNSRLQKFSLQGAWQWRSGSNGAGDGQLSAPAGIALLNNRVYIADTDNRRVAVFAASNGAFVKNIGQGGKDENELQAPVGIAFDSVGKMFVADSANKRVQVYERDESPVRMIAGGGGREDSFGVLGPGGIVVAADDTVWASDPSNHRIMLFDFKGKFFAEVTSPSDVKNKMETPMGLALDAKGRIYVADAASRQIFVFNANGGVESIRNAGDLLLEPTYVAVDPNGWIYVTDATTLRVVVIR